MSPIVEARGLTKRFGRVDALTGLDLIAESGQVTALLGPNGAGKTTFVSAVATLLRPDSGELRVAGIDARREPRRVRRVIGLAGQSAAVEEAMTGRENLEVIGRLFGLDRRAARSAAGAVLERLGLTDAQDRLVRTYSGGMRRRLDLGASLVGRPKLLLMDEPTAGLDPRARSELWTAIRELVADGTDVLLTTQYLEEADQLARQIVIIDHGHAVAAGTPAELKARAGREVLQMRSRAAGDLPAVEEVLRTIATEEPRVDVDTATASVRVDRGADQLTAAVSLLQRRGIVIDDISLRRPSLDEVFLALTGHQADPAPDVRGDPPVHAA
jgi:ABC-2 type transport system ATP-binding protein